MITFYRTLRSADALPFERDRLIVIKNLLPATFVSSYAFLITVYSNTFPLSKLNNGYEKCIAIHGDAAAGKLLLFTVHSSLTPTLSTKIWTLRISLPSHYLSVPLIAPRISNSDDRLILLLPE